MMLLLPVSIPTFFQVRGKPLVPSPTAECYYFAVHKPPGYICSNVCQKEGKRAVDLLKPWLEEWEVKKKAKVGRIALLYTS
jgi:16S rRNA U516 pseudouridylate synthase RsuA-like enzyme